MFDRTCSVRSAAVDSARGSTSTVIGTAALIVAWCAVAAVAYAYVGYPLIARLFIPRRAAASPLEPNNSTLPMVTVLIAARNEVGVIAARLRNLLEQDYPAAKLEVIVVSDASDDGTDQVVESLADPRVRLLRQEPRRGKTAGINQAAPLARGELLVQTDANVVFEPGALRALSVAMSDPKVGLVLGEVRFVNDDAPQIAGGEGLYWRWETWVKRVEAERGLLTVANGGIYALRRSLWRPLPESISGDAAEPLLVLREGFALTVARGAVALERASGTLEEEYHRKARIIAQQVACARFIGLGSLPSRVRFAYVSHKLARYAVPWMALVAASAALTAVSLGRPMGAVPMLIVAAPFALAGVGWLPLPSRWMRWAHIARYLVMVNAAAWTGVVRGLRGGAQTTWEIPASTRG